MKLKKVLVALGFAFGSLTLIAPTPSKAEGGCPGGFYPVEGGYCRNIECVHEIVYALKGPDTSALAAVRKYNKSCPNNYGNQTVPTWGQRLIPKR
jgi:hypothetical protein